MGVRDLADELRQAAALLQFSGFTDSIPRSVTVFVITANLKKLRFDCKYVSSDTS